MTHRTFSHEAGLSETLGLLVGGGAVLALITAQVLFIAWII